MRRPPAHEMPCQACTTISQIHPVYQKRPMTHDHRHRSAGLVPAAVGG